MNNRLVLITFIYGLYTVNSASNFLVGNCWFGEYQITPVPIHVVISNLIIVINVPELTLCLVFIFMKTWNKQSVKFHQKNNYFL